MEDNNIPEEILRAVAEAESNSAAREALIRKVSAPLTDEERGWLEEVRSAPLSLREFWVVMDGPFMFTMGVLCCYTLMVVVQDTGLNTFESFAFGAAAVFAGVRLLREYHNCKSARNRWASAELFRRRVSGEE